MEKMAWGGPKWGREDFFATNPGLANILGRTDLDFFLIFWIPNFQISRFQISKFPEIWPGPGLGQALVLDLFQSSFGLLAVLAHRFIE